MASATNTTKEQPIGQLRGLPLYANGDAPKHLRSKSQLRDGLRLRLAPGQQPVCYVRVLYHPDEPCALYDPADAEPPADQSLGAVWAYQARRTCPKCGIVREHIVHGSQCGVCWRGEQSKLIARQERTCDECGRVGDKPYPKITEGWYTYWKRLCRSCRAERRRKLDAILAAAVLCPGGCGKRTAAKKTVLAWAVANHRAVAHWRRVYCPPCDIEHQADMARREAEQRAKWAQARAEQRAREEAERAARRQELADLRDWAIDTLADPDTVILDTETTGLHDTARIVDIAVTTATGETLLNTLVNPGEPIPADASGIHGITDAMVTGAPTFAEILPDLEKALTGKRILIYNKPFDLARLGHELNVTFDESRDLLYGANGWLGGLHAKAEDAMEPYSAWYGDWSDWHGNYRWQRLNGGHRAHGDCLAVIDCLKAMARPSVYEEEDEDRAS